MIISGVVIAGSLGASTLGVVKYREQKRQKEYPWTVAAEKFGARRGLFAGKPPSSWLISGSKQKGTRIRKAQALGYAPQATGVVLPVEQQVETSSFVSSVTVYGREFVGKLMAPYVSQTRRQQLAEITAAEEGAFVSEAEKEAKQTFLLASCGTLLMAGGSLFYTPLYVPGALIMAYLFKDTFRDAYKAFVEERRMGVDMIVATELPAAFLSGFLVMGTFGIWYSKLMRWILTKTEDSSRKTLVNLFGQQPVSCVY